MRRFALCLIALAALAACGGKPANTADDNAIAGAQNETNALQNTENSQDMQAGSNAALAPLPSFSSNTTTPDNSAPTNGQ